MNIYEKLNRIQVELKAPKDSYNSFGKYKYRALESILEALKPLLGKYKCVLLLNDSIEVLVDRFYIKSTATLIDLETELSEGDFRNRVSVSAFAREDESRKGMDASQLTGATSSYARKYALNGLFAIDDTKDSDYDNQGEKAPNIATNQVNNVGTQSKPPAQQQQGFNANSNSNLITENQVKRMYALAKGDVEILKKVLSQFDFTSSKEVTKDKYNSICELIQSLTSK